MKTPAVVLVQTDVSVALREWTYENNVPDIQVLRLALNGLLLDGDILVALHWNSHLALSGIECFCAWDRYLTNAEHSPANLKDLQAHLHRMEDFPIQQCLNWLLLSHRIPYSRKNRIYSCWQSETYHLRLCVEAWSAQNNTSIKSLKP